MSPIPAVGRTPDTDRPAQRNMLAGLRHFADLPARLAQAMDPGRVHAALTRHVPELATGELRLVHCVPSRLRAKGEQWLARYELTVEDPAASSTRPVVLVGTLAPPSSTPPAAAPPGSRFGCPQWTGYLADLRLRLHTELVDDSLPMLPVLTDPDAARELLERGIGEQSCPGIRITRADPEIVRYKPGSRCTLRYQLHYANRRPEWPVKVVVKTHQGEKGANAFGAMTALWATDLAGGDPVELSRPLAYLPQQRVLVQAGIRGTASLTDAIRSSLLDGDLTELQSRLELTARGLAAIHGCGVRHGRVHTWDDELAEVREVTARLGVTVPAVGTAADPLLAHLEELAAAAPADPVGPAHHDFRPGQVLVHDEGIGFIDFDGFCTAEPALDIGRFRAKLRDVGVYAKGSETAAPTGARLAERIAAVDELCEGFLDAYLTHAPVSRSRVLLWETLDLLTALLHAWTKVRTARVVPRLALLEHQVRRIGG
ncbi:MAG TPA: phosphotransferase [Pseudonocardia sp.]|nr:phosphotransferase [Pseudonocardia sp.]